ncbi:MAG: methyltransferase domain-containing protein [Anaerolineae bacterium]|nr:methyltransferase domain-containing protein [Anaerolineae bacterium]
MMSSQTIDFGKTAQDYSQHRAGFPEPFFERLAEFGVGRPGQRVLDLGTGTGTVARGLARRGCQVIALDPARPLMDQARRLDQEAGVMVAHLNATAEKTGLAASSFEVVTAGQCWHWFDRPRAAREVRRLLVPGGHLVIAHFDWLPLPGNVVEATEQLIQQVNPAWAMGGGTGLYPAWLGDVAVAGFQNIQSFSFDVSTVYSHAAWRGRIRASAGVAASLPPQQVADFDKALGRLLAARFPTDPLPVPHRVFTVICHAPTYT